MSKTHQLCHVRLPVDLLEALDEQAERDERTRPYLIAVALRQYLARRAKQRADGGGGGPGKRSAAGETATAAREAAQRTQRRTPTSKPDETPPEPTKPLETPILDFIEEPATWVPKEIVAGGDGSTKVRKAGRRK